ncbi:class I SAM-dependent methyltransferase [Azonexus hydrophilus]|jgi:2-polyprenyl-3-methyl-5-hydroxy-6-metoxy-1,4-benzoquinol methylase|uniref:Class I SAM-dependent methyltransferase n=1 Tax=Azonexus hydrophilus TaxID=418702 RepID=A0ABZ2XGW7_9RHOO|nr:class I SAM-dependent methyltransferase [Dechloromonas sp.]
MNSSQDRNNLKQEAQAFDSQIEERVSNGHIPDLRRAKPCDYFYNNSWRRPEFVKLDFIEQYELIRDAIKRLTGRSAAEVRVLEVGCGPGYLSLELARSGFEVVGLDLSSRCIEVAQQVADSDPWRGERGALHYIAGDYLFHPELHTESFDAIVFLGALHHFTDQRAIQQRTRDLLKPGGLILVHEPARDRVAKSNAAFSLLLSTLLSLGNNFYRDIPLRSEPDAIAAEVEKLYHGLRYESEDGGNLQSVNDNEAGYTQMYPLLNELFAQVHFEWRYAFFHEFIGGLRYDETTNALAASFLKEMDRILVDTGALPATEFFFVGRKN